MAFAYGDAVFGYGYYSATKYIDGAASIAATSATSSPTGTFVIEGTANTIQGTSSTASAAVEVYDGLALAGASAVGSTATGVRVQSASATSSASASNSAAGIRIGEGSSVIDATAAFTSAGLRIGEGAATSAATTTTSANAVFSITVSVSFSGQATIPAVNYIRYLPFSASTSASASFTASGVEKWEPIGTTSTTWATIAETSTTWTNIAA